MPVLEKNRIKLIRSDSTLKSQKKKQNKPKASRNNEDKNRKELNKK